MNRKVLFWVLFVLVAPATTWVVAQGLQALTTPDGTVERGITMAEVQGTKGDPSEEIGPVGSPPITKWVFGDGEVVVFEADRVVDSFFAQQ